MGDYEGLFIIKPDIKEEDLKNVFKTIGEYVLKNGGSIKKEENWGKRLLAYPIKRIREAYYYKLDFSCLPSAISKLDGAYRLNADILRTMITRR